MTVERRELNCLDSSWGDIREGKAMILRLRGRSITMIDERMDKIILRFRFEMKDTPPMQTHYPWEISKKPQNFNPPRQISRANLYSPTNATKRDNPTIVQKKKQGGSKKL